MHESHPNCTIVASLMGFQSAVVVHSEIGVHIFELLFKLHSNRMQSFSFGTFHVVVASTVVDAAVVFLVVVVVCGCWSHLDIWE